MRKQLTQAEHRKRIADNIEKMRIYRQSDEAQRYICEKKHGITLDRYNDLFAQQKGKCAICGTHESQLSKKGLAIDHDHETNKVRGLLCGNCNRALGFFKDDIKNLKRAIRYIQTNKMAVKPTDGRTRNNELPFKGS